ncbi:MAG: hypothetical protein ACRDMA_12340 [Solirubrobacterales bacterium]
MNETPGQQRMRERIESVIGLAAPALDLLLAAGDRVARIASPADHDYRPVKPPPEPALLEPPGDPAE